MISRICVVRQYWSETSRANVRARCPSLQLRRPVMRVRDRLGESQLAGGPAPRGTPSGSLCSASALLRSERRARRTFVKYPQLAALALLIGRVPGQLRQARYLRSLDAAHPKMPP
jgi:hypothetical protein